MVAEGIHQLTQNVTRDDVLRELFVVVGKASKRERCALLDGRHVVEQQWAQQLHHTRGLECLYMLWARREIRDRLHKLHTRFLVLLEDLDDLAGHLDTFPTSETGRRES